MSVAQLTARELGLFCAIAHKHAGHPLPALLNLAERISHGNIGAWAATYNDRIEPAEPEEIERWALDYLAGRREMVDDYFGPLAYNMISNDGGAYLAPGVQLPGGQGSTVLDAVRAIEGQCKAWQDKESRAKRRAEEDAASFDDIGPHPYLSAAEVRQRMAAAGANRVIIAEFGVNESDSQSDYYGGRIARRVIIGFATGKRESFRQLRKAAGAFPPTASMGPGRDKWRPRVVLLDDVKGGGGGGYWKGCYSHWHSEIDSREFGTRAEAENHVSDAGEPHSISFDGKTVRFGWQIEVSSYENRENYSMGGRNYLGASRYGGWKIRSIDGWGENQPATEFFTPTAADLAAVRAMEEAENAVRAAKPPKPKGPFWTAKGFLQERDSGSDWPQCFRKLATVEAKQAELRAAGIETEVRCGRRHNHFYLKRVETAAVESAEPVQVQSEPTPEPVPEVELLAWL